MTPATARREPCRRQPSRSETQSSARSSPMGMRFTGSRPSPWTRKGSTGSALRARDGRIKTLSNPVWVRRSPPYRLYWGETHTHTGMAEGQGSIGRSYRFAREDARLDFLGLSEHDIWLDDAEWLAMRQAVKTNTVPGEFVAFLGYEWTLRRQWGGHHNVFFRKPDSMRVGAQKAPTPDRALRGTAGEVRDQGRADHSARAPGRGLADQRPRNGNDDRDHVDARNLRVVRQLLPPSGPPGGFPCGVRRPTARGPGTAGH